MIRLFIVLLPSTKVASMATDPRATTQFRCGSAVNRPSGRVNRSSGHRLVVVSDLIPRRYHRAVDPGATLRRARLDAGLSLRALADRAGTSHATLAAYEHGRAVPRVDTLDRILRAAGYATDLVMARRPDGTDAERRAKGDELREALELAAQFPARHATRLRFPRLRRPRVA